MKLHALAFDLAARLATCTAAEGSAYHDRGRTFSDTHDDHAFARKQLRNLKRRRPDMSAADLLALLESTLPMLDYFHEREGCPSTLRTVRQAIADGERTY